MRPPATQWPRRRDSGQDSENARFYNAYLAEKWDKNTISGGRFCLPTGQVVVGNFPSFMRHLCHFAVFAGIPSAVGATGLPVRQSTYDGSARPVPEGLRKLAGGKPATRERPPDTAPIFMSAPAGRWNDGSFPPIQGFNARIFPANLSRIPTGFRPKAQGRDAEPQPAKNQAALSKTTETRKPSGFKISCNVAKVGLPFLERIL